MEQSQRPGDQLTRRAVIAFAVVEAVMIFGAIAITMPRKQRQTQTSTPPTR